MAETRDALKIIDRITGDDPELRELIEEETMNTHEDALAEMSQESFDALMEAFTRGTEPIPPLPPDFSRDDIYSDHD